jgi:dipeptidyl aminopeptidase/acylaminoacyl peptidase
MNQPAAPAAPAALSSRVPALVIGCLPCLAVAAESPGVREAISALTAVHVLSEVSVSPDGEHVIYGQQATAKRGGSEVEVSTLWMASAKDGSALTRLTACPGAVCDEHSVAWSPDGARVAFVTTDAKDQPQLALATVTAAGGTHPATVTHAHGPLDTPRFSPDGRRIAFLYSPGAPKTPGPLNPLSRDAGVLSEAVYEQRLAFIPAQGGEITLLGPSNLNVYEYDWSPDGKRFAITAAHGSGDENWWLAELDICDAQSGAVKKLLKPSLQMASPRFSGDGRLIAYIGGIMSDEGITGGDAYVLPSGGGTPVDITPNLAASVQTIAWNGSATRLFATEFAAGDEVLATIDVASKSQQQLWRAPQMIWANSPVGFVPGDAGISLARDGAMSAVILQSYTSPPEIETGPPGKWHPITRINAGARVLTGKATNVFWKSDAYNVQGMLIEPHVVTPGKRYPLVVRVHGGPALASYPLFPANPERYDAVLSHEGYFVFEPNARGSYGQGEAFTRANVRDFGYGDLRDILRGIDAVLKTAPIDPKRVGITGWSYGGYMTMWALTQTNRFRAAVAGAGVSDWLSYYGTNNINTWMLPYFGASVYDDPKVYEKSSPLTFIRKVRTPTLIVGGDRDAEVPITQSYEYWKALKTLGVKTEFVVYPDEGHLFFKRADQVDVMSRLVGWFDTYLKPGGD